MRARYLIPLLLFVSTISFGQDTANTVIIKIKRPLTPLSCVYSQSNTIYTNVTNILQVNYPDSSVGQYSLETELGYIQNLHRGKFMVVKHNPGGLTISLWKDSAGKHNLVATQEFMVRPLPNASITVGGYEIDTTAYISDLLKYRELELVFGDFTPLEDMCFIKSFDLKIGGAEYHSESNMLTDEMANAIKNERGTMQFENVMATINSPDDMEQTLSKDKKKRVLTQKVYTVEDKSKPIQLMR
jgi:hypothetical protein